MVQGKMLFAELQLKDKKVRDVMYSYLKNKIDWRHRPALYASISFLLVFFLWAGFFQIEENVRGTGRIVPTGRTRLIQHLEGGIVQDILVEEGQVVKKGDILFNIMNKDAESVLKESEITLQSYYVKQERLKAEQEGKDELVFSKELEESAPAITESERQLFLSRRLEFIEKINGLEERFKQKAHKLEDLRSTVENLTEELEIAKEQLGIKKKLYKTGAISRSAYLEAESEEKNFITRISKVEKEIPVIQAERAEIYNLIEETKQGWHAELVENAKSNDIEIERLKERILALKDRVSRIAVASPVKGIVNKVNFNTIGGVVQPGQVLAEITPTGEKLLVEGRINTQDRGKIWLGLPVMAKITAYDYTIYGGIEGTLTYISSDSFFDSRDVEYYKIQVTLNSDRIGDDMEVFPGMTANIGIITNKTTILNAILRPLRQLRANAFREA